MLFFTSICLIPVCTIRHLHKKTNWKSAQRDQTILSALKIIKKFFLFAALKIIIESFLLKQERNKYNPSGFGGLPFATCIPLKVLFANLKKIQA